MRETAQGFITAVVTLMCLAFLFCGGVLAAVVFGVLWVVRLIGRAI